MPDNPTAPDPVTDQPRRWLVTGAAGFVGFHLTRRLLADPANVVLGVDAFEGFYDPGLKRARAKELGGDRFEMLEADLADDGVATEAIERFRPDVVVHLAALAGVRSSVDHPMAYVRSNLTGFTQVLEAAARAGVGHVVYASSSSVYGETTPAPFTEANPADHPVSVYAATKRAGEMMAHAYADTYGLPVTGLRFFTVYGPWGRPDMAYWIFTEKILQGEPITIFGDGTAVRDFTFIDDVIEGLVRVAASPPRANPAWDPAEGAMDTSRAPWRVLNIGHGGQATVNELIAIIEDLTGRTAVRSHTDRAVGDVAQTHADPAALEAITGWIPPTDLRDGLAAFVDWYRDHHGR